MSRCSGFKANGEPCQRIVGASQKYCSAHDPDRSEARKRAASKAGRSKPNKELGEIKRLLSGLVAGVLTYKIPRATAAVANQLLNTQLRALEVERKLKETEEFEARIEELESRWGA